MALKMEIVNNWVVTNEYRGPQGIPEQDKEVIKGSVLTALIQAASVRAIQ